MPNAINLVGIGASYALPGVVLELDFAQGPVSGTGSARACLLMGNMTTSGTATADTVVYGPDTAIQCQTESDVINLFGNGSQLHRMFLRFVRAAGPGNTTPLYFIAVAASAGTAASTTCTIVNAATANGNHRFWCGDEFVDTPINSGDAIGTIATNIANSINAQTRWPITASPALGVVTITAKIKGPEGNWIRVQALITPGAATIATTTTLTANTYLTSGATADNYTNALATIIPTRFYYIVCGDSDATNVGRVVTQVSSQAQPTTGIRQRVIFGAADTLANTITLATGVNNARAECVWGNALDLAPSELAAGAAGVYATLEQGSPFGVFRKNFSRFPVGPNDTAYWPFIGGRSGTGGAPTNANLISAINNGITALTNLRNGSAQLVKRCTTYSLNGSTPDYRVRDGHKPSVCDYFCDDAVAVTQLQFGGKDLLPDPVQGQPPPGPQAVTPRLWGNSLKSLVQDYGSAQQWTYPPNTAQLAQQNLSPADAINSLIVGPQIEVSNPNRMSVQIPVSPVSIADVFALLISQVA